MYSDILIIGAGGAGLTAALHAKEKGVSVRVLTKEYATRSQTCMAQGGMNAALGNNGEDSIESHVQNTLKSAQGMADEKAVRYMCEEAPKAIEWLDSIGVCFSRTDEAKVAQRTLGGASASRACYAQDYTGLKILHTLYDRSLAEGIEIDNEKFLLEILTKDNRAYGAKVLDIRSGAIEIHEAKAVILATGGYSKIYDKHSTNSKASTGDGLAVAMRAGARLKDMAFVQFHPTGLQSCSIMLSESARGAGGYLVNSQEQRFVDELLPRDKVARAIHEQIEQGEEVFLDIRHLGEAFIDKELPQERKLAKLYENVDPVESLVPIKPVAHYTMGGIEVDSESKSCVEALFAVGECANHNVHGANRLGGNSLLEIVVFGKLAGKNAAEYALEAQRVKSETKETYLEENGTCELDFYEAKEQMSELFYKDVSIVRKQKNLEAVATKIQETKKSLALMGWSDTNTSYNTNKVEFLEFVNSLDVCEQVVANALQTKQSCGAHYRVN